jgi:hypothetical protein
LLFLLMCVACWRCCSERPAAGSSRKLPYARADVLTTSGQRVPIVKANVHVGQVRPAVEFSTQLTMQLQWSQPLAGSSRIHHAPATAASWLQHCQRQRDLLAGPHSPTAAGWHRLVCHDMRCRSCRISGA